MRKITACLALLFFAGCSVKSPVKTYDSTFISPSVIQSVNDHTVAIAVYYFMGEQEYNKRMSDVKNRRYIMSPEAMKNWNQLITGVKGTFQGKPVWTIAYIGAGTILKDNHILSVRHLFAQEDNTYGSVIWVMKDGLDHAVGADVVAISSGEPFYNDYAVIKMKEDLKLPGLKIAKPDSLKQGDLVIFSGSVGGTAFFTRFGFITLFQHFFSKDSAEQLHLSQWDDFPYWCVYPGGPGDSGGSVKNSSGEIVTLLYCGIENYSEEYIFGNTTAHLIQFLKDSGLEKLGE